MIKPSIIASVILILLLAQHHQNLAQAQRKHSEDSLVLDQTATLLLKMDSSHRADSIRRLVLLQEIEQLKGPEHEKREELLIKLRQQELLDSLDKLKQHAQLARLKSNSTGYPVAPFLDTLFFVYTRIGSFTPAERAASINIRIENLYDNYEFQPDSLKILRGESTTEIVYKEVVVMSVNELEAMWHNKSTEQLASYYRTLIKDAIRVERDENTFQHILIRVLAILLIIGGMAVIIWMINRMFRRVKHRIIRLKESVLKGIKIKNYQFLDSDRTMRLILFAANILRLTIIVITLYIALPLLFSVFPWTEGIAQTLIGWVVDPLKSVFQGLLNYLPNLFAIIVIIVVTRYVSRFLSFIAAEVASGALTVPGFYSDWARPTLNIVKFLLYAFSFVIIFPYLPGSDSPIFKGVSVFVGILFSLGSSSAISNAVAGLVITYMRPFRVGDRIKIGEICGDVIEKTLLVTRIRTIKNEEITVPNGSVLSGHTINYTTSAKDIGLILHTGVTIGYDVPWRQVHELLMSAALSTRDILTDEMHRPFILQKSLDDFYVSYELNVYTGHPERMSAIYSFLHQNIQDKFNESGVEIMSPHYRAARDGNATTVPASYLPKDYETPSFRVQTKNSDDSQNTSS